MPRSPKIGNFDRIWYAFEDTMSPITVFLIPRQVDWTLLHTRFVIDGSAQWADLATAAALIHTSPHY
jgi:hypothetical protein